MKTLASLTAILLLAACGVDTASTAATAAAVKKQEIEQGQQTMEHPSSTVKRVSDCFV